MNYDIVLTENAEEDLEAFVSYILHEKQNPQAARSILDDFDQTTRTAGSLKLCGDVPPDDFVGRGFARLFSLAGSTHTLCPLLRGSLL